MKLQQPMDIALIGASFRLRTVYTATHNRSLAHRLHTEERFHAHIFTFSGGQFVADMTSNAKAVLGR